jgi:hypothetical protein
LVLVVLLVLALLMEVHPLLMLLLVLVEALEVHLDKTLAQVAQAVVVEMTDPLAEVL